MEGLNFVVFLTWFLPLVGVIIQILILVAFYGIIKHFGNCPACGRRISNEDKVCNFCGTKRLTRRSNLEAIPAHLTRIICPSCGEAFGINSSQRGTVVQCPHCQENVTIPSPGKTASIICPACNGKFGVESSQRGSSVQCPYCKENVRVK